jgi:hypothetical protein
MRQALKLALEWFEKDGEPDHHPVVTAIKEALAQPEQEPVAYLSNKRQRINIEIKPQTFVDIPTVTDWEMPLYMKPPQRTWVGLTQDELNMIGDSMRTWNSWTITDVYFAIEAKLKEKNT